MAEDHEQAIVNRLKSIEGHVRGIQRMVENGDYCIDIVNQILAVQRAMQKVNGLVLDRHLHTCVTTAIQGDDPGNGSESLARLWVSLMQGVRCNT